MNPLAVLRRPLALSLVALAGLASPLCGVPETGTAYSSREVDNLAAFARVYGYVRFFYPSDAATQVDWDKVAIIGAEEARYAGDAAGLRAALSRVFQPIAPKLELGASLAEAASPLAAKMAKRREPVTFWQYFGIRLLDKPGPFQQRRVVVGVQLDDRKPLFEPAIVPQPIALQLAPELALRMPTALPVQKDGTMVNERAADLAALQARLAELDLKVASPADWRVRIGGVVTVWAIFQHFHPYLDGAGVRWEDALRPALRRALNDLTEEDYYHTLSEMIAKSQDGHGYVYGAGSTVGGLPVRVTLAENQIVVVEAADAVPLEKGDVIQRVDGVAALDVLRDLERYTPGSPHLRQFRALNQFGEGPAESVVRLEIVRDDALQAVELKRHPKHRSYFFKRLRESDAPGFAEVRPGIYYVNLYAFTAEQFESKLPELAEARGLIFDWRMLGHRIDPTSGRMLQPHSDIIPHLIDEQIQASPMLTPKLIAPDRAGWVYRESTWPVKPQAPRFKGRVIFISEPSVVSYGETCMAMIADYRLATLVGAATAGCNGNANFIELPGGFRVMWTGMDVRKHNHMPFYGVGFGPDVPVARTVRAVKEGRDEYLDAAIRLLEGAEEAR